MGSDLAELTVFKAEHGELREKVLSLEEEKHNFEYHYDILAGEKALVEDQVTSLDVKVAHLSQQVETLTIEKKELEEKVKQQGEQLS